MLARWLIRGSRGVHAGPDVIDVGSDGGSGGGLFLVRVVLSVRPLPSAFGFGGQRG